METDTVLLTVSLSAGDGRPVPLLPRERFEVFEDGVRQNISYFFVDNRPVSVGLLIDNSDFMGKNRKMESLREVVPSFLKGKNPADEYFVIQFDSQPRMTVTYTTDAKLAPTLFPPGKDDALPDTALSDSIYLGIESIKEAANPRKALLVVTAGGDRGCDPNSIVNRFGTPIPSIELVSFAMKQPAQIYSMIIADEWGTAGVNGTACKQIPEDQNMLDELASATGGLAYVASNSEGSVNAIAAEVARSLRNQFLIGYKSTNSAKDGKRRAVKVKASALDDSLKLKVWTKSGYIAPKK